MRSSCVVRVFWQAQLRKHRISFVMTETWNCIVGCGVIAGALGGIVFLTLWSRQTIERIAHGEGRSAREITRELEGER